jgi:hypothetical protein
VIAGAAWGLVFGLGARRVATRLGGT